MIGRKRGSKNRKGDLARLWEKISPEPNSGCWLWIGAATSRGYGNFWLNGRQTTAYRASYEMHVGPVPDGLELDHKCRIPMCVNPDHLEPVTHLENIRRGDAGLASGAQQRAKTHCPHGHAYDADNTYHHPDGYRACRACSRETARKRLGISEERHRV